MAELIKKKKKNIQMPSSPYFAVKSQNELYYQMASIFKHAAHDEDGLAKEIFFASLVECSSEFSPVN